MNRLQGVAAATIIVGLVSACAGNPHVGNPAAPIDVKDTGLGYRYSQTGHDLEHKQLLELLQASDADVEADLDGQGALLTLSTVVGVAGGALIGIPFGLWGAGEEEVPWHLAGIGAGTLSVGFPIAFGADARLHRAVLRHNARHGKGDVANLAPLRQLRSAWLLRSIYSGGYTLVDESVAAAGPAGDLSFAGVGVSYDWSMGYFVVPGLALSANILALSQLQPKITAESEELETDDALYVHLTAALAGATYYPFSGLGFYAQAAGGYGMESASHGETRVQPDASGLVLSGALGWDFTLAHPAALGVVVRGVYAPLGGELELATNGGATRTEPFVDRWTGLTLGLSLTYY